MFLDCFLHRNPRPLPSLSPEMSANLLRVSFSLVSCFWLKINSVCQQNFQVSSHRDENYCCRPFCVRAGAPLNFVRQLCTQRGRAISAVAMITFACAHSLKIFATTPNGNAFMIARRFARLLLKYCGISGAFVNPIQVLTYYCDFSFRCC